MKRGNRHLRHAVKGGTTRLKIRGATESPALPPKPDAGEGLLRIESRELIPPALVEAGDAAQEPLFGPIMWLVIILGLSFIGFIAWLIS